LGEDRIGPISRERMVVRPLFPLSPISPLSRYFPSVPYFPPYFPLIDTTTRVVQFYAITSAVKGCGRQIVEVVIGATPEDWCLAVVFDWSGGFWQRMAQDYPRLVVF
jgi:hypothetical protein